MMSMALSSPFPNISNETRRVQKCLFGRPTCEKQAQDFEIQESRLFQDDAKRFSEKWGLDPITGTIVNDAEYKCEPVDLSKETIPSFYLKSYHSHKPGPVRQSRERLRHSPYCENNQQFPFVQEKRPTKRKLSFNNSVDSCNDLHENNFEQLRVPAVGDDVKNLQNVDRASSFTLPSTPSCDVNDSLISMPSSSGNVGGFLYSKCLHQGIRVRSKDIDLYTPPQRPGSLKQKTIKDFMPLMKKARLGNKPPRS